MSNCLKCGNPIAENAVFCDDCLTVMDQHPIKPGTIAHLLPRPQRPEYQAPDLYREAAHRAQLQQAKRTSRLLMVLTVILSILLLLTVVTLLQSMEKQPKAPPIGKNYTTTQQSTP